MKFVSNNIKFTKRRQDLRSNSTKAEDMLWEHLRSNNLNNLKFRRQQGFGYYIVDFYCKEKKLIIELDGDSHLRENGPEYDLERTKFLEQLGLKVIRFSNDHIFNNLENVLESIRENLH